MGCCYSTLISAKKVLTISDGVFQFSIKTGGLTLIRGYVQQDIPGGTLFVTDTSLVHCTKACGYNRIDFEMIKMKELQYSDSFGNSCNCHFPCIAQCPDSYIIFRIKIDGKDHQTGIKVKNSEIIFEKITKIMNKKVKRQLSVISEESQSKVNNDLELKYHVTLNSTIDENNEWNKIRNKNKVDIIKNNVSKNEGINLNNYQIEPGKLRNTSFTDNNVAKQNNEVVIAVAVTNNKVTNNDVTSQHEDIS